MGKSQPRELYIPPGAPPWLGDFIATLKELFRTLYIAAHDHACAAAPPNAHDGKVGDLMTVDDGTSAKLYVKTARGWFYTAALTGL